MDRRVENMTDNHDSTPDDRAYSRRRLLAGLAAGAALPAALNSTAAGAEPPVSSAALWNWARAQQVINPRLAYLDTASIGPALRSVLVAQYRAEETFNTDVRAYLTARAAAVPALAERIARWLNCAADELCFTTGATEALNIVANGLELAAGDEIVTTVHEHDAALAPWLQQSKRRGIVVKQVPLPSPLTGPEQALGLMAGAVTERTKVMAFCHIQPTDGAVLPVRELCSFARQRKIFSVVDGALACGAAQYSLRELGCDFYAASLHKWMNGPYGGGLLYVRSELIDQLWPLSTRNTDDATAATPQQNWPRALRKFGTSFRYFGPQYQGLEAALTLQEQIGRERVEYRIRELAIYAKLRLQPLRGVEILTPAHPAMWGGIMSFKVPTANVAELATALAREDNVIVQSVASSRLPFTALRTSFHIYNSHDDIERLLRGLQRRLGV